MEEAKAKPYAENYRYLVALQEGYVMVASKSEALILQELVALGVPVEYEPTIEIEGRTYKGDFRVRNKNHEEIEYYWEHLGMLKDPSYRKRWKEKEEAYRRAGIEEGRNLLVTRDEEDGGVDRGTEQDNPNQGASLHKKRCVPSSHIGRLGFFYYPHFISLQFCESPYIIR